MLVSKRMTKEPVTVKPDDTLAHAHEVMEGGEFRQLPVVVDGELVGILTDRDLREHHGHLEHTKVNVAMTENPETVTPGITLEDAAQLMLRRKFGALPVVDRGKLVGIITSADVMLAFTDVMGASEQGSARIDLLLEGGRHDITGAFRTIEAADGRVLSLGTYADKWDRSRVFYIRVHSANTKAITGALEAAGYKVVGVHD